MPSSSLDRLYKTARWQRTRAAQLAIQPLCEICLETETVTVANTVHHKDGGHKGDAEKFWNGPFQSLCPSCHSRHGAAEDSGRTVVRFGPDGWPL